jgi:predicted dehydrogenase
MGMTEIHIGVVGAGDFAKFAITAFLRVPGIKAVAISDINQHAARSMGTAFNLVVYEDFEQLLKDASIQLIYIATPPYLHFEQSRMALLAGKHVICEKPAALKTSEAETLVKLAKTNDLLYVVNLMQRYNPLFGIVKAIVDERLLGDFLHGFFENYASDELLAPGHWFWDLAKSGGIFIEHGVHFFDLFSGWLGNGKVHAALQLRRPAVKELIIDRVQATVLYKTGPVNFYHGFDQPKILDRQEMRLLFERGEITLFEWVPVKMKLHGLAGTAELKRLEGLLKTSARAVGTKEQWTARKVKGRFKEIDFDQHITLEYENGAGKQELYQQMLTDMITDQWNWIKDHTHIRVIDDDNAVQSLKIAEDATAISKILQQ